MRVIVAGAGNIGRYLSLDLATRGHDVALLDVRPEPVLRVVDDRIRGVIGDACSPSVLEGAGVREADVVVAATGDDEDNLVISLLAKQEFAVPRVLARVNHPANEWLFNDRWGVDLAVSPPHLLTSLVEEEVVKGDLVSLLRLQQGQFELLEVDLDERARAVGQRVEDLDLPPDVALLAVVRSSRVVACRDTTPLVQGDKVLALARAERKADLRQVLLRPDGTASD